MPDRRSHRGPHPDDLRLFAAESWPGAFGIDDLCWLLGRAIRRRRRPSWWGIIFNCSPGSVRRWNAAPARRPPRPTAAAGSSRRGIGRGRGLWIDGYNVLTTVEAALAGGVILVGRDGCYRDMASMHGSYRKVSETRPR